MPRRLALGAMVVGLLLGPATAQAWTDAAVRNVHARIDVEPDGTAYVQLRLLVRVHGGWLEGLELNGLDEDLVLDEATPPAAVHADGREFTPSVRVLPGGRVQLGFRRRSPRRGALTVTLAYYTSLAHRATEPIEGTDRVRVQWTLPGWSSGLDGPQIELHAPEGAELAEGQLSDLAAGLETSVEAEGEATVMRWRRAHLPRTVPWTVAVEIPEDRLDPDLRGAPVLELPAPASVSSRPVDPRPTWWAFAAWLLVIALAKMLAVRRLARRSRSGVRALIPMPALVRGALILALAATGAWLTTVDVRYALGAFAVLALLATYRPGAGAPGPKLGAWRVVDARWLSAVRRRRWARWVEPAAWVDATTWIGALHLGAVLAAPWLWPEPPIAVETMLLMSVVALPIFLGGTRLSFPPSPVEVLLRLLAICRRLEALPSGVALRPVMHVSTDGEVQDARVRTVLGHRPDGLLRLDLAMGQLPHAGGTEIVPMLLVLTRAGRPAEEMLCERFGELTTVESRGGRRVLRAVTIRDADLSVLEALVEAFADVPAAPAQARGVPLRQQTVAELPPPRAVGF